MRDERAQHFNLAGDKVIQTALLGFINRNYAVDELGRWYFQNGPQRVYVNLEATPFIARTDPAQGLLLQTGEAVGALERAWMTETGALIVEAGGKVAQIDDRDVGQLIAAIEMGGATVSDDALLAWLDNGAGEGEMALHYQGKNVPIGRIAQADVARQFGFTRLPVPVAP
jgi:hypothetical protein